MDRARIKSKAPQIRRRAIVIGIVVLLVGGITALANIDFSTHRVDRDKLSFSTVQQGTMEVKVSANGQLLSNDVEQIVSQVSGRVARKAVKPGALVKVGQPLVELTNPDLVSSQEEAELAWEGAKAQLQSSQTDMEKNILNQESVLSKVKADLAKGQLKTENDRSLFKGGDIAQAQLKNSEYDLTQLTQNYAIQQSYLKQLKNSLQDQLEVSRLHVTELARAFDRARTQAADLQVLAGIRGIVQSIDVEIGQQMQPGSPVGSIAQQDSLYAELKVPAREAAQVQPGQTVVIDTRNGLVNGVVTRVNPSVSDGTVVVDADLKGALPPGARPQLQVEGIVYVTNIPNTLYVGKPSYVKNNAAISVYRLDPAGKYATRVTIKAGQVSVNYMRVLQGLKAGDRIITSEIGEWQGQDRILLK